MKIHTLLRRVGIAIVIVVAVVLWSLVRLQDTRVVTSEHVILDTPQTEQGEPSARSCTPITATSAMHSPTTNSGPCPTPPPTSTRLIVTEYQRPLFRDRHSLSRWPLVRLRALHGRRPARQGRRSRNKLAPAFNTSSGFPRSAVDTYNPSGDAMSHLLPGKLAEIASFQMEYAYLGKVTGKKEHADRATTVTRLLHNADLSSSGGMYPTSWDPDDGTPTNIRLSVGAAADSAHEYTLKQYLLTARSDKRNLEMYLRFTTHVINNLLFVSPHRQLLYVTDSTINENRTATSHSFEHLSCFFPGLLALGVHLLPLGNLSTIGINFTRLADDLPPKYRQGYEAFAGFNLADLHLWAAEGIAQTCYLSYADQPSGLGPDAVSMRIGKSGEIRWMDTMQQWKASGQLGSPPGVGDRRPWVGNPNAKAVKEKQIDTITRDYSIRNTAYYLRPETVESFYILWRTTGDVKWRHRGWSIFQAIERVAKTPSGYACVDRVQTAYPILRDSMPSYFLAETLKYLYLLFLDDDIVPLEKWVFNTGAHPLPVFDLDE